MRAAFCFAVLVGSWSNKSWSLSLVPDNVILGPWFWLLLPVGFLGSGSLGPGSLWAVDCLVGESHQVPISNKPSPKSQAKSQGTSEEPGAGKQARDSASGLWLLLLVSALSSALRAHISDLHGSPFEN
jgi:hypothetical protein